MVLFNKCYGWHVRKRAFSLKLACAASAVALLSAGSAYAQDSAGAQGQNSAGEAASEPEFRFDVMEYVVRGNTVLSAADIQTVLMPFAGYGKTVPDVDAARAALEKSYRDRGYATVVVEVPQQDVSSGIVELSVTEGRVGQVRVTGADYVLPSEVKGSLPSLKRGEVPNVPQLQKELSGANARTSRTITPEFTAGLAPGTVDINLAVDDKRPWGAAIELNDQFNRSTERLRLSASAHYDNLWQAGHSANILYQFAPENFDQVQVFSGSYYAPLGYGRTSLLGYVVSSNTDVATLSGMTVIGDGLTIGGRVIHSLSDSAQGGVHSLLFGLDYKDYLDQIGLIDPDTGDPITGDTPVTYLPFTAQYRWLGGSAQSNGEISIGATFAFDGLVGKQREFGDVFDDPWTLDVNERSYGKRAGAQASFIYFYGSGVYNRKLPGGFDVKAGLDWQIAPEPLISNEQFVLGGASSIRGYREAEILGDSGGRLSLELGYKIPVGKSDDIDWRVASFFETGYAWNEDPQQEEKNRFWMGSVGLTSSIDIYKILFGQFDIAYQLKNDPSKAGNPAKDDLGGMRIHFKIGLKY